ncbi:hypothetical protein OV207_18275 [Corallococcus sp. BB11-1]|uniref:hypothetical protein n=1 Tax=Corallococcus sp. BB11-1 TaxID=2996783 RepID=UPI0022701BD7|nr:hypothetical protein [Corallococcus sp. BB11-1]MCY1033406.1 hypothetical protein [Corallococcus sp. BB11-1]
MSVRLPPNLPRPGVPARGLREEGPGEKAKPGEGKASGKASAKGGLVKGGSAKGTSAKGGAQESAGQEGTAARSAEAERGGGDAAKGSQQKDGMAPSTQRGAAAAGFAGLVEKPAIPEPTLAPQPQAQPQAPAPQVDVAPLQARQLPTPSSGASRERTATDGQGANAAKEAAEGRAKLRLALINRLFRGLSEVVMKLTNFLANPGRQGVVTLPVVLSESSVAHEWWKSANAVPEDRQYLALALGEPPVTDDAALLQALRREVNEAFTEFLRSPQGVDVRKQYDAVLQKYEAARIQPVIAGHDTGPLLEECARLGQTYGREFTRSLLLSPWMLAISQSPDEGSHTQVMVAGLTLAQLGALVGHLRRLNPLLSNAQLRTLLLRASTDMKLSLRKALGQQEVEQVQELARQLLRLRAVEHLVV